MNVQNRKLFRNKDARRQLAAMGGIMQSSPELMGEAMRFAEGGTARERAISGQGALDEFASSRRTPVDLRAIDQALGSRVQDVDRRVQTAIVSFLGNVFQVVGDRIFHSDTGVEIEEPSLKQEILTQGDRIAAEDMAMAQDIPQGQTRVFAQPEAEPEVMFPGELSRAFVPQGDMALAKAISEAEEGSLGGPSILDMRSQELSNVVLSDRKPDDRSGLERLEAELEADPENIRAKVARLGQAGKRAAEIADILKRPIREILDIGLGLASEGTVELGALTADLIAAHSAFVNNPESAEFYYGVAQNLRKFGDESYYGEGDILPRISNTDLLQGDPELSEAEQLAQQREQIRKDSLAATLAGEEALFADGTPVEFLPEDQTYSFPRKTSVTGIEGLLTAPEMAQSNLPEINVTPSPIETMSGSGLTLPAPPQGRVGDMPIEELIDFSTPSEALASETLLRNRAESAAIENEMDDALDPIVPFNTEGGRATALGEETAATKEALDAEVAVSPLQEAAREALYPQRAREFREQEANRTNLPLIGGSDSEIIKAIEERMRRRQEKAVPPLSTLGREEGDFVLTVDPTTEEETVRPKPRPKELENAYAAALAAAEASTNPDASLPDTIGTNLGAGSSSSIEEATKAQYKFLKDFLGIGERDKQKEFNLMAMQFFTALAAGQSPDALANLNAAASTAIAGLAAGDKERTDFDRELKLAAYEQGQAQMAASVKRRDAMARAYLSAGLMPEIDEATGQITGYKVLPQKNTSTYTPERLRQTLLEQIVKSENAEDFGLFTDGKIDMAKANKFVEQMMKLGSGLVDEDSSTGDFSEMKKLEDAARERGESTFVDPDGQTRAVRP